MAKKKREPERRPKCPRCGKFPMTYEHAIHAALNLSRRSGHPRAVYECHDQVFHVTSWYNRPGGKQRSTK